MQQSGYDYCNYKVGQNFYEYYSINQDGFEAWIT